MIILQISAKIHKSNLQTDRFFFKKENMTKQSCLQLRHDILEVFKTGEHGCFFTASFHSKLFEIRSLVLAMPSYSSKSKSFQVIDSIKDTHKKNSILLAENWYTGMRRLRKLQTLFPHLLIRPARIRYSPSCGVRRERGKGKGESTVTDSYRVRGSTLGI